MKIAAVSDSHLRKYTIPKVDVLVHAGDHTLQGNFQELNRSIEQLKEHKENASHIVVIAGNHERVVEKDPSLAKQLYKEAGIIYLQDDMVEIQGVKFYGSPYTPEFCNWAFATHQFDAEVGIDPEEVWSRVPEEVDVLITHGPPWGRFDVPFGSNSHVGCPTLMRHLQRIKPQVHVFGHIHSPGDVVGADGIRYINAAVCNGLYERVYEPTVFEIEPRVKPAAAYL